MALKADVELHVPIPKSNDLLANNSMKILHSKVQKIRRVLYIVIQLDTDSLCWSEVCRFPFNICTSSKDEILEVIMAAPHKSYDLNSFPTSLLTPWLDSVFFCQSVNESIWVSIHLQTSCWESSKKVNIIRNNRPV